MEKFRRSKWSFLTMMAGLSLLIGVPIVSQNTTAPSPTPTVTPVIENIQVQGVETAIPEASILPTTTPTATPYVQVKTQNNYYKNVDGDTVQSPTYYDSAPAGATAKCNDGTYSFSQHRQGTCSRHHGVAYWL